jgi:tRNA nucleotidyltransferase (CCA-adding enzyme)
MEHLIELRQRLIRVLHGLSFHDDPTRAFRAARVAARFDFRLAPQTEGLLRSALRSGVLRALGPERLGAELDRILDELEVVQAFRLLRDWELLPLIHPRFVVGPPLLDQLAAVAAALVLAACVPEEDRAALIRLVPGDRHAQRRWLHGPERARRALAELWPARSGSDAARALESLDVVERTYALGVSPGPRNETWLSWWEREGRQIRCAVSAADLMARGAQPGPALGAALRVAQEAAWDGATPETQLAAAVRVALPSPVEDGAT